MFLFYALSVNGQNQIFDKYRVSICICARIIVIHCNQQKMPHFQEIVDFYDYLYGPEQRLSRLMDLCISESN